MDPENGVREEGRPQTDYIRDPAFLGAGSAVSASGAGAARAASTSTANTPSMLTSG